MTNEYSINQGFLYITGSERRHAKHPRRSPGNRRYRIRFESLLYDCRSGANRRSEDDDGFLEFESLYKETPYSGPE
ncbi:MAG: hypothetical protein OQK76_03605 [Gammaproteobacteria bacterium]|nr:hypothetical protein [Gammaproteobacteria bacterium]MCW8909690.1 hypothetical protein [Gammaproteobacteria bacterium]MCW9004445.1 hypothetical protein [Gammaproteobacteria bacterium]MCW9055141.1 hypothetical protein [Gammaproteobacteria bacterium]